MVDELADNSEDETWIEKAKKAVERKAGLKKCKRSQPIIRQMPAARSTCYITPLPDAQCAAAWPQQQRRLEWTRPKASCWT